MTDRQVKMEILDKIDEIAKEIAKGKDICITKNASGIVVKKITVQKV